MVFSDLEDCLEFEVALKDIYLFTFGCFRGTLVVSNVLGRFFFSSEIVTLATLMGRTYLSVYTQICVCGAYSHEFYFYYSQIVFIVILTLICPDCRPSIFRFTVLL